MNPAVVVEIPKNGAVPVSEFKIVAVAFVNSVPFANESSSVQVGRNCDSVKPARLRGDGTPAYLEDSHRADGLLIRRTIHSPQTNQKHTQQVFVPFANIRGIEYGK